MTVIKFPDKKPNIVEFKANQGLEFISALMQDISHFAECALDNTYGIEDFPEHELEAIRTALSGITDTAAGLRRRILGN
ncbi:hypothetical protein [Rouxiella badensis]|uniref:hypothetical protein n=1 Tax=Rouxiella badensis TaxID=1646377 RepID=UPI0022AB4080|nr:hypothetical protein [Rouxiella badensis]WAT10126.1 hypothetical protein O1V65_06065 [Rouxiella badensis]